MSEITIHTGNAGDVNTIHVDWFDHNNKPQRDRIDIVIEPFDKPRQLTVLVNGRVMFTKDEMGERYA